MSSCSEVMTCLSEGSTECTLSSGTCPPCVYALSGGDFSCYSRDTSGDCPFSAAYAECDKSSSSTTATSSDSNGSGASTPASTTKAPAATTATPTKAPTSAPVASTSGTSSSTSSQASSSDGTSTTATQAPSTTTTSSSSDAIQSATTPTSSSSDSSSNSGAEKALTSTTSSTSGSPAVVNLALIGGAVVLVVVVIAFIARRVSKKKKKMYATQEHTVSSHNSAWSDRTLNTGNSGGNLYSTYSYKNEGGKGNDISIMSDSQASSTYGPGYPGQPGSKQRSTADFSNFGGHSQYTEDSQYYSDYSVSTGPELLAAGAVAGTQPHYANNGVPPSTRAGNHFVDVTATSASRDSELDSMRSGQQPLTVSQLMPTAFEEDEEEAYATRRKPAHYQPSTRGADPRAYNLQAGAVPPSSRKPQIFATSGVSDVSSMRSDYDIVDPITMQEVEARNTEMLAEDSRYPKFSFESESDIYDGSSSGEESDDDRARQGEEHTI